LTLEPGEMLIRRSTIRWIDPPVVPASPFLEAHIIVTNQRVILLGESHHQYMTFEMRLSDINRVDSKGFPGAGIVKMFAGTIVVFEYWSQGKIKIIRVGVNDADSLITSVEQARQALVTAPQRAAPTTEETAPLYCPSCGHQLKANARYCPGCGKAVELP
jgi:NADH pyrophosphatase NudC (nudix superfamily)